MSSSDPYADPLGPSQPGPDGPPADPMAGRIARFADLQGRGIPLMFIDSVLPGHKRMNYAVIGDTASENPEFEPIITEPHAFQIGMVRARPGNGPAYHTHDYVESFLILSGRWRFYWGTNPDPAEPDGETILTTWDYISLPPALYRGFEVCVDETEEAWCFAVLEPHAVFSTKDPIWSPHVVSAAAEAGFHSDDRGKLVFPDDYPQIRDALRAELDG